MSADQPHTPAPNLVANLRDELQRFVPFSRMAAAHVDLLVRSATQTYYAPGETLLDAGRGTATTLFVLRRGHVARQAADGALVGMQFEPGDLFPVAAVLGQRAVTASYVAAEDCFCLEVPAEVVQSLAERSASFADFLNGRVQQFLAMSRQALQASSASQALSELSMEARLGSLPRRTPVACAEGTPLIEALRLMQKQRVGSVLVLDDAGAPSGIVTQRDVLERVALAQPPMDAPVERIMSRPVHALDAGHTLQEAALLMSRHGVRHVPVTEQGRVVGVVSERDLFAMQSLSLKQLSRTLREAPDPEALVRAAPDIRRFAGLLLAQGLSARSLTELVSHLNDVLAERLVTLLAARHGLDLRQACWLAFGSEGRGEQTIATDQDNGLVFDSERPDADRVAWLAMAREVNQALHACGYPLCKGGIMAGNAECCLTPHEWIARFAGWIEHGAPEDLLAASIFFDFRALSGAIALAAPMREFVRRRAAEVPRFARQLAENALRNAPALNWRGALDLQVDGPHAWVDLKLHGTMIFVDAARLYALVHGVEATGTRARFEGIAAPMHVDDRESRAWVGAFEFLQMLRLRAQVGPAAGRGDNPNRLDAALLDDIDRRMLREALRVGQRLQQRIRMDYLR